MPQLNQDQFQITGFVGMSAGGWTAVVCPLSQARALRIFNLDATNAIDITTDNADATAVTQVAAASSFLVELSPRVLRGWQKGQQVLFVRGAGAQPKLHWMS